MVSLGFDDLWLLAGDDGLASVGNAPTASKRSAAAAHGGWLLCITLGRNPYFS